METIPDLIRLSPSLQDLYHRFKLGKIEHNDLESLVKMELLRAVFWGQAPSVLYLVFFSVKPHSLGNALKYLDAKLPGHSSMYQVAGEQSIDIIVRGPLDKNWAANFRQMAIREEVDFFRDFAQIKVEPLWRYRWQKPTAGADGPMIGPVELASGRALQEQVDALTRFIEETAQLESAARRWAYDPNRVPVLSSIGIIANSDFDEFYETRLGRHSELMVPIRDIFRVLPPDDVGRQFEKMRYIHYEPLIYAKFIFFLEFEGIAFDDAEPGKPGVTYSNVIQRSCVWRQEMMKHNLASDVRIIHYVHIRESHDVALDPIIEDARRRLRRYEPRVPFGFLKGQYPNTSLEPDLQLPVDHFAIIGGSGSGKSTTAFTVAAALARANYDVLYVNYKDCDTRPEPRPDPTRGEFSELKWIVERLAGRPVTYVREDRLAEQYRPTGPDRPGEVFYLEASEKLRLAEITAKIPAYDTGGGAKRRRPLFIIYDEIMNHLEKVDDPLEHFKSYYENVARTLGVWYGIVHQDVLKFATVPNGIAVLQNASVLLHSQKKDQQDEKKENREAFVADILKKWKAEADDEEPALHEFVVDEPFTGAMVAGQLYLFAKQRDFAAQSDRRSHPVRGEVKYEKPPADRGAKHAPPA